MRKIYQITENDQKKVEKNQKTATGKLTEIEKNRSSLGKKYGLQKRNATASALKGNIEYLIGQGQGRLDQLAGLPYSEDRLDAAYNMGYHDGYTISTSGWLADLQGKNENFDWYFKNK